jgi:hypothetical protein
LPRSLPGSPSKWLRAQAARGGGRAYGIYTDIPGEKGYNRESKNLDQDDDSKIVSFKSSNHGSSSTKYTEKSSWSYQYYIFIIDAYTRKSFFVISLIFIAALFVKMQWTLHSLPDLFSCIAVHHFCCFRCFVSCAAL